MPRHLDQDAREHQVIEAAWRVIARDGVAAVTVRNVATEAQLAPSSLRYVFPTQASVRERAVRAVLDRMRERLASVPNSPDRPRLLLLELLPLDAVRHLEMEVSLALGAAATTDAQLRPWRAEADAEVRRVCMEALAALDVVDNRLIVELHALIDGLAAQVIMRPNQPVSWAEEALDFYLRSRTVPQNT